MQTAGHPIAIRVGSVPGSDRGRIRPGFRDGTDLDRATTGGGAV